MEIVTQILIGLGIGILTCASVGTLLVGLYILIENRNYVFLIIIFGVICLVSGVLLKHMFLLGR